MPARVATCPIASVSTQMLDQVTSGGPSTPQLYDLLPINSSITWSHHGWGLSQLGQSGSRWKRGREYMQLT